MGAITTKYSVGDKVYVVDSRGISNEFVRVALEEIRGIQLGNYGSVVYEFRIMNRRESDIYVDLSFAKAAARKQAKERYEHNIELIEDEKLPGSMVQGQ